MLTLSLAALGAGLEVLGITDPETGRVLLGLAAILAITSIVLFIWPLLQKRARSSEPIPDEFVPSPSTPELLILHDKPRDTEPWPNIEGYSVKFRVLNDSDVSAKHVGARIRTLEFLERGEWRPYGHDYAEVPLATPERKPEFDLRGGDEESVYIARRSVKPGESIQLCYARDGIPNTIPLKPAWRVGICAF